MALYKVGDKRNEYQKISIGFSFPTAVKFAGGIKGGTKYAVFWKAAGLLDNSSREAAVQDEIRK